MLARQQFGVNAIASCFPRPKDVLLLLGSVCACVNAEGSRDWKRASDPTLAILCCCDKFLCPLQCVWGVYFGLLLQRGQSPSWQGSMVVMADMVVAA